MPEGVMIPIPIPVENDYPGQYGRQGSGQHGDGPTERYPDYGGGYDGA